MKSFLIPLSLFSFLLFGSTLSRNKAFFIQKAQAVEKVGLKESCRTEEDIDITELLDALEDLDEAVDALIELAVFVPAPDNPDIEYYPGTTDQKFVRFRYYDAQTNELVYRHEDFIYPRFEGGAIGQRVIYDMRGDANVVYKYTYDKEGELVSFSITIGNTTTLYTITWDENGRVFTKITTVTGEEKCRKKLRQ